MSLKINVNGSQKEIKSLYVGTAAGNKEIKKLITKDGTIFKKNTSVTVYWEIVGQALGSTYANNYYSVHGTRIQIGKIGEPQSGSFVLNNGNILTVFAAAHKGHLALFPLNATVNLFGNTATVIGSQVPDNTEITAGASITVGVSSGTYIGGDIKLTFTHSKAQFDEQCESVNVTAANA